MKSKSQTPGSHSARVNPTLTEKESSTCLEHNKPAQAFCRKCVRLICVGCIIGGGHQTHNFRSLKASGVDSKVAISALVAKAEANSAEQKAGQSIEAAAKFLREAGVTIRDRLGEAELKLRKLAEAGLTGLERLAEALAEQRGRLKSRGGESRAKWVESGEGEAERAESLASETLFRARGLLKDFAGGARQAGEALAAGVDVLVGEARWSREQREGDRLIRPASPARMVKNFTKSSQANLSASGLLRSLASPPRKISGFAGRKSALAKEFSTFVRKGTLPELGSSIVSTKQEEVVLNESIISIDSEMKLSLRATLSPEITFRPSLFGPLAALETLDVDQARGQWLRKPQSFNPSTPQHLNTSPHQPMSQSTPKLIPPSTS